MQEEISQRTIAIMIRGAEFSANTLEKTLKAVAGRMIHNKETAEFKGQQSLKSLQKEKTALESVELSRKNLRGFERIAKKYGINYSLVRDKTSKKPQYILFFKGRDQAVMDTAFREYAYKKHGMHEKESIRDTLKRIQEQPEQYRKRNRSRQRNRTKQRVRKREVTR